VRMAHFQSFIWYVCDFPHMSEVRFVDSLNPSKVFLEIGPPFRVITLLLSHSQHGVCDGLLVVFNEVLVMPAELWSFSHDTFNHLF